MSYANGYLSQWDQFTTQIASIKPYMVASGNHEHSWPDSGGFYATTDLGGECGVPAETMYYVPAENRAKFCIVHANPMMMDRGGKIGWLGVLDNMSKQHEENLLEDNTMIKSIFQVSDTLLKKLGITFILKNVK